MGDEDLFEKYLKLAKTFSLVKPAKFIMLNPLIPSTKIEIDNICQKNRTLFIFEGKKGNPDISQLKKRFIIFEIYKTTIQKYNYTLPYQIVRVFHYNLQTKKIIEYDKKGNILLTFTYKDIPKLIDFLQKL